MSTTTYLSQNVNKLGDGGGEGDYEETRGHSWEQCTWYCLDGGFHGCMHLSKFIKLYALNMCSLLCHLYFNKDFFKNLCTNKKIKTEKQRKKHDLQKYNS